MDHGLDIPPGKNLLERCFIPQVRVNEHYRFSGYFLNTLQGFRLAVGKIVHHDKIESRFQQLHASVAADIAGAARDQYLVPAHVFNPVSGR